MKITVTKGNVKFEYEEPQNNLDYPIITTGDAYHKRVIDAIKLICEQVIQLSK